MQARALVILLLLIALLGPSLGAQEQSPPPEKAMDYGPFLMGTISPPGRGAAAIKGVVVPLAPDGFPVTAQAGYCFDTELLRPAFAWRGGFLELKGTAYDGSHGTHPRAAGRLVFATKALPGAAKDRAFADPRPIPYGPLPARRWRGLHLHGRDVVFEYDVMGRRVLEHPSSITRDGLFVLRRDFSVGPGARILLCAEDGPAAGARLDGGIARYDFVTEAPGFVASARARGDYGDCLFGPPSAEDYADVHAGHGVEIRWVEGEGLSAPHRRAGARGALLPRLNDGRRALNHDDVKRCVWFDGARARILVDLKQAIEVARVQVYSWHRSDRAPQRWTLYGAASASADPTAKDLAAAGWAKLAEVDTTALGRGVPQVASVGGWRGRLGRWRLLLLDCRKPLGAGTFFHEIDVYAAGQTPPVDRLEFPRRRVRAAALAGADPGVALRLLDVAGGERAAVEVAAAAERRRFSLLAFEGEPAEYARFRALARRLPAGPDPSALAEGGGGPRWPQVLETRGLLDPGPGPYVVDTVEVPFENPWHSRMRLAAFDFFPDGKRLAVSTWNGDVWIVSGVEGNLGKIRWKRFATGLFDPLGLKIVDGVVHTLGRDGITRLHDRDGDGEADDYECFNNEVYASESFHEFAFDLQTDAEGNFYFAKAGPVRAGGRGFEKILPHHGCILKVPKDGRGIEVFATGLRAPNGISVAPPGVFGEPGVVVTSGDNEGTWMPQCRLNWIRRGAFLGCPDTSHREPKPKTYDDPLCWIPWPVDNSSGGQVWVPPGKRWGPFGGSLLHLSYGTCSLFLVLIQHEGDVVQGGVVRFPLSFASGIMRARFHPKDGRLWVCGLKGWQTSAAKLGCLQRVRYTGGEVRMPRGLHIGAHGIELEFACALDEETAADPESFEVRRWNYLWTSNYGSPEVSVADPKKRSSTKGSGAGRYAARDEVPVRAVRLAPDRRRVWLALADLRRVMQMSVRYNLDSATGGAVKGVVWLTVNRPGRDPDWVREAEGGRR